MSVSPARRAALQVLRRLRQREAFGAETLDAVLATSRLSPADVALATRLSYGVMQTMGVLDEVIDARTDRPGSLEPGVRDALRVATYELLHSRTPQRAVVHEGVEAVKGVRPQAAGMANAVLRRIGHDAGSFPWGDPDSDDDVLARATAHPRWLVDVWVAELGREAAVAALSSGPEGAPLYLWHNPFRGSSIETLDALETDGAEPLETDPPGCILAQRRSAAIRGSALRDGRCMVADATAQLVARVVAPAPGSTVVDLAAGRGAKTAQMQALAVQAGGECDLYAVDIHPFKVDVLSKRMDELGVPGVTALVGDATAIAGVAGLPSPGEADAVLLDAPCTGLGTLRRHPEKRWRISPDDPARLAVLQAQMLEQASLLVRPEGYVVYSTCTVSARENQQVVGGFLESSAGRGFETADLREAVPGTWHDAIGPEGWFQSVPTVDGPDGHFVARLRRRA